MPDIINKRKLNYIFQYCHQMKNQLQNTMKIITFLFFASLLMIYSCSNDKSNECSGVTGILKVTNNSDYKYDIYIEDVKKGSIAANGYGTWPLGENYYAVRVVQAEGYSGSPTEYSWNLLVTACGTTEKIIP